MCQEELFSWDAMKFVQKAPPVIYKGFNSFTLSFMKVKKYFMALERKKKGKDLGKLIKNMKKGNNKY